MHTSLEPACLTMQVSGGEARARFAQGRVRLDWLGSDRLAEELHALSQSPGPHRGVLDMGAVEFLASDGLAVLLAAHKTLRRAEGALVLCNVPAHIYELFAAARLHEILDLRPAGMPARAET